LRVILGLAVNRVDLGGLQRILLGLIALGARIGIRLHLCGDLVILDPVSLLGGFSAADQGH
jgi:hypothetical protein